MIRQLSVGLIGLSLFNPIPKNQKQIKFCKGVNPHYVSTYDLLKSRITYNTNLEKQKLADELISKFQQQIIDKQKEYDNEMYYNPYNISEISNISIDKIYDLLSDTTYQNKEVAYQIWLGERRQYPVNALFVIGLTKLESFYGKSNLALNNNNITGTKSTVNRGFKYYNSHAECINELVTNLSDSYINPNGKYYNGTSIWNIRRLYCQDNSNWEGQINNIINNMKQ